jgi:hypothetical protein
MMGVTNAPENFSGDNFGQPLTSAGRMPGSSPQRELTLETSNETNIFELFTMHRVETVHVSATTSIYLMH